MRKPQIIKGPQRTSWGQSKLTLKQRAEINRRANAGLRGIIKALAKEFKVHPSTISAIKLRTKGY